MRAPSPRGSLAQLQSHLDPATNGVSVTTLKTLADWTHCQEDKDISLGLRRVDLEDGGDGGVEVVCLRLRCVENVDGVSTTRYCRERIVSPGVGEDRDEDALRKTGASSKYSLNLAAFKVALEMRSRKSGLKRAIS